MQLLPERQILCYLNTQNAGTLAHSVIASDYLFSISSARDMRSRRELSSLVPCVPIAHRLGRGRQHGGGRDTGIQSSVRPLDSTCFLCFSAPQIF